MVTPSSVLFLEYSGLTLHKSKDQPPATRVENDRSSLCKLGGMDGQVRLRAESWKSHLHRDRISTLLL